MPADDTSDPAWVLVLEFLPFELAIGVAAFFLTFSFCEGDVLAGSNLIAPGYDNCPLTPTQLHLWKSSGDIFPFILELSVTYK